MESDAVVAPSAEISLRKIMTRIILQKHIVNG